MTKRQKAARAYLAQYPSPPVKPWAFNAGDRVRHVSGDVGVIVGREAEYYSLNRSDFYRVENARGVRELHPAATISLEAK